MLRLCDTFGEAFALYGIQKSAFMLDFKVRVFYSAAVQQSFTKAAQELLVSQPAASKAIKLLEHQLGHDLFIRSGGRIELTKAGEILKKYVEQLICTEKELQFELGLLDNQLRGMFTVGASTTIAQYIIPRFLLQFSNNHPQLEVKMISGNTSEIEMAMEQGRVDLGIVEGDSRRADLKYIRFMDDRLTVVCHSSNPISSRHTITPQLLCSQPIILRERGSGTLEVVEHSLKSAGLNISSLNVKLYLGSTESIKNALQAGTCIAVVSERSVATELEKGTLCSLDVEGISFNRELSFVTRLGGATGLAEEFMQFALANI